VSLAFLSCLAGLTAFAALMVANLAATVTKGPAPWSFCVVSAKLGV